LKIEFKNAKFISSAVQPSRYPHPKNDRGVLFPEIAVIGRSNVGKSSLLNDLFQSKGMVKTSSVPGKTQLINFFTLNDQLTFVDLPGYGYAKVPLETRKKWGPMIQHYLEHRSQLEIILFLFDIRRLPTEEDCALLSWLRERGKPVLLILTKVDKVTLNQRKLAQKKILERFGEWVPPTLYYSTLKRTGRRELMGWISQMLNASEPETTNE
jgi:GTP-binding protein